MTSPAKPTILIVDDDSMNRELLQTVFQRNGYPTLQAINGTQALQVAEAELPGIILCDVRMGGMSGYEVCQNIRANPVTASIPFIILTAYENAEERQKAIEAGATDFVPKMSGWAVLLERVRSLTI